MILTIQGEIKMEQIELSEIDLDKMVSVLHGITENKDYLQLLSISNPSYIGDGITLKRWEVEIKFKKEEEGLEHFYSRSKDCSEAMVQAIKSVVFNNIWEKRLLEEQQTTLIDSLDDLSKELFEDIARELLIGNTNAHECDMVILSNHDNMEQIIDDMNLSFKYIIIKTEPITQEKYGDSEEKDETISWFDPGTDICILNKQSSMIYKDTKCRMFINDSDDKLHLIIRKYFNSKVKLGHVHKIKIKE